MEAILYIGIAQSLFAGILIALKRPRIMANQILAAWLLIIGIDMAAVLVNDQLVRLYPIKFLPFLYGPLLYLYTSWMTKEAPRFHTRSLLHFVPFLVFMTASLVFIKDRVMEGTDGFLVRDRFVSFRIVYGASFFISITAYSVATFVVIHRHRKRLAELVSFYSGRITLRWLLGLSITFYVGYVLMFIFGGMDILLGFMPFDPYEISFIGLTILAYLFSVFGFHQPDIFEEVNHFRRPVPVPEEKANHKYQRSGLKKKDVDMYLSRIHAFMEKEKPYLNRELSIYDLSNQLDIPRNILSELINEHLGQNFYTLVNTYRVEEVKKRLADPARKHLTILAIALDAGFNAKSSFNTIFKERTGLTPSEYQRGLPHPGSDGSD
ncbi:MAG: helix-turn-helix domain-containing protein [Bacteroidales bacterium]